MSADWGSFFHVSGNRSSHDEPKAEPVSGDDEIVEPDQGGGPDVDKDMIGSDVGTDLGGYSAEESAMHLEPEA